MEAERTLPFGLYLTGFILSAMTIYLYFYLFVGRLVTKYHTDNKNAFSIANILIKTDEVFRRALLQIESGYVWSIVVPFYDYWV